MTVQELLIDVYEQSGELSYLSPYNPGGTVFNIATAGAVKTLGLLNRAYGILTNYKQPNGWLLRFKACNRTAFFTLDAFTGAISSTGTNKRQVTLTGFVDSESTSWAASADDALNGWVLEMTSGVCDGEKAVIIDWTTATDTAILATALSDNPTATDTFKVYRSEWPLCLTTDAVNTRMVSIPVDGMIAIQRITDLENESPLDKPGRADPFVGQFTRTGSPSQFWQTKSGIKFDRAPDSRRSYLMEYYGTPETLSTAAQVPAIPQPWHELIGLIAAEWALRRSQEWNASSALKNLVEETILKQKQQNEMSMEYDDYTVEIVL